MALPQTSQGPTDWFDTQGPPAAPPAVPQTGGAPGTFDPITGAPTAPATGPRYTGNPKADFLSLVQGRPVSRETLAEVFPQFAQWYPGSTFEKGDIKGPWGWADVIGGLDDPSKPDKWQWYSTYWRGAGGEGVDRRTPDGMTSLSGLGAGELAKAPGFQFRISEGQKALERSAAARGTLLTGGTLKAITRYGQDFASNEYNNRYNQLYGLSNLGLNAAGQQASGASSYAANTGNLLTNQANTGTGLITQGANTQAAGTVAGANINAQTLQNMSQGARDAWLLWYVGGQRGAPPSAGVPGATPPPTTLPAY